MIVNVLQHQVADNAHQLMSTISRFFINNNYYSLLKIQTETLYRHWKWKAKFAD